MAWRVGASESGTSPAARPSMVRSRVKLDFTGASELSWAKRRGNPIQRHRDLRRDLLL